MSLALGTVGWDHWIPYVVATVLFEAVVMGRWLQLPLRTALPVSIGANLLSAGLGGVVSGPLAYPFLGVFGSRLNPNPIGQTLLLFVLFGMVSAVVEAGLWVRGSSGAWAQNWKLARNRCLVVHLLGVPLGLGILLTPERPYRGLEMQVAAERQVWLQNEVR